MCGNVCGGRRGVGSRICGSEPEWDEEGICDAGGNKSNSDRMLDTYRDMKQRSKYFKDDGSMIAHWQRGR